MNKHIIKALNQAAFQSGTRSVADQAAMLSGAESNSQVFSPLMQRYMMQYQLGGNAMNWLPRDPNAFIAGQFSPSYPTLPQQIDPAMRSGRPMPRQNQYPVGYNLPTQPGITKLVPFQILRSLADMYDIARLCIDRRKAMISGLTWDILPREDALQAKGKSSRVNTPSPDNKTQKAADAAPKAGTKVDKDQVKKIKQFFQQPNRIRGLYMADWLKQAMEEVLVIDALSIYEHPSLGKSGGFASSDIHSLEIIAGDTIKPLIDERGTRPLPPNPAFQQYIYGVPRSEFVALLFDAHDDPAIQDLQRGFPIDDPGAAGDSYRADQLAYLVSDPRAFTLYGFSAIEKIIINTNIALKRQQWHQAYFDDGDIPAMLLHVPDAWNLDQIQRYEAMWHAKLSGDVGWKHRMYAVPGGEKAEQLKPPIHNMDFDHYLAVVTCAGLGVDPSEIGLASLLSSSIGAGMDDFVADRRQQSNLHIISMFENYFTSVIERYFGADDIVFNFDSMELQDVETEEKVDNAAVKLGAMSLNEYRAKRGMERIDVDQADGPNVYLTRDVVPVDQIGTQQALENEAKGITDSNGNPIDPQMAASMGVKLNPNATGGGKSNSSPTPRANGASGSGGSATNPKVSPSVGRNTATKIAGAMEELRVFERYVSRGNKRRFVPDALPQSIVDKVYKSVEAGRDHKALFAEIRRNQAWASEEILGEVSARLLEVAVNESTSD